MSPSELIVRFETSCSIKISKTSITQALAKLHTFERAFDMNLTQMITKKTGLQPGYISIGLRISVKLFQPHGELLE